PTAGQVFVRASKRPLSEGVPGMFTVAGYGKAVSPAVDAIARRMFEEESWVLGSKTGGAVGTALSSIPMLNEIRRRYFEDYAKEWDGFLGDIRLAPSADLSQTLQLAKLLSGPESPLRRPVPSAAKETSATRTRDVTSQ